jgi:hypothetical protein
MKNILLIKLKCVIKQIDINFRFNMYTYNNVVLLYFVFHFQLTLIKLYNLLGNPMV